MSELSAEDAELLARWKAGPGARPTAEEGRRMLQQMRDGVWPVRRVTRAVATKRSTADDQGPDGTRTQANGSGAFEGDE